MTTFTDKRGLEVTVKDAAALAAHEALTEAYLGFRIETGDCLRTALKADADAPLIQAMAGYVFHLMALRPLVERAVAASAKATELAANIGNEREKLHAAALAAWTRGDLPAAADRFEAILLQWPHDILALKLCHYIHFYLGNVIPHRDSLARVLPAWSPETPGYAAVLGMRAFGLEEAGDFAQAERYGRRAVELDPSDSWAVHAVAHVLEMTGRHREGVAWIDQGSPAWVGKVHNFANHVWWHKALYHLEMGQHDAVLDLYDTRFWADDSNDGLDISNAAAMLARLQFRGVACGDRWARLAGVIEDKFDERLLPFNDVHYMLVLAGAGDGRAAEMAAAIGGANAAGDGYWADVYRRVAGPMAAGIAAYGAGDFASCVKHLAPVRYDWNVIGGSHAQRDVFQQMLIDAAERAGDLPLARALLRERAALKPRSADVWTRAQRVATALNDPAEAAAAAAALARLAA